MTRVDAVVVGRIEAVAINGASPTYTDISKDIKCNCRDIKSGFVQNIAATRTYILCPLLKCVIAYFVCPASKGRCTGSTLESPCAVAHGLAEQSPHLFALQSKVIVPRNQILLPVAQHPLPESKHLPFCKNPFLQPLDVNHPVHEVPLSRKRLQLRLRRAWLMPQLCHNRPCICKKRQP